MSDRRVLDIQRRTRERFEKRFPEIAKRKIVNKALAPLAEYLATTKPPEGLEEVIGRLTHEQLSLLVLEAVLNQIFSRWDLGPRRSKKWKEEQEEDPRDPRAIFCEGVGSILRDELEYEGLLIAKPHVDAPKPSKCHRRLI